MDHRDNSNSNSNSNFTSPIFVALLSLVSAALVLTVYHCLIITWCNSRATEQAQSGQPADIEEGPAAAASVEISMTQLLPPSHTYGKGEGMFSGAESACPVCLSEFKDGEAIRLLPGCVHYFHVPCIDTWLRSHSTCPVCRAGTTPVRRHHHLQAIGGMPSFAG